MKIYVSKFRIKLYFKVKLLRIRNKDTIILKRQSIYWFESCKEKEKKDFWGHNMSKILPEWKYNNLSSQHCILTHII